MAIPLSIERWFASQYPTLRFNREWLQGCYDYLVQNFPNLNTTNLLIKEIESQLLLSDLSESTVHHERLLPEDDGEPSRVLFVEKSSSVMVQVLEVLEIGTSALNLLERHRERMEDKKLGREVRRPIMNVEPTQRNNEGDAPAGTAAAAPETDSKGFPRSMLRLRVSDGFTEYVALESKRISKLSMEDTPLGHKLLLTNVRCLRGQLMLDSGNCNVKGGQIAELEQKRDELLEALLERRIKGITHEVDENEPDGPAPARRPTARPARDDTRQTNAQRRAPVPPANSRVEQSVASARGPANTAASRAPPRPAGRQIVEEDFDDMLDDDFPFDHDDLQQLDRPPPARPTTLQHRATARPPLPAKPSTSKRRVVEIEDDDDDDEELWASIDHPSTSTNPTVTKPAAKAVRRTTAKPAMQQQPIEIESDDIEMEIEISDSDDEVQQELVLPSQTVRRHKMKAKERIERYLPIEGSQA